MKLKLAIFFWTVFFIDYGISSGYVLPYTNVLETVYIDGGKHLLRVDRRYEGEFVIAQGTEIIGLNALSGCYALTSVVIPDTVTNITAYAFAGCQSLTNVVFGNGVRAIGERAFGGCERLRRIELPDSLETIGRGAFSTSPLKEIRIGSGLRDVGVFAFGNNQMLNTNSINEIITISPSNQWIRIEGTQIVPIKKVRTEGKD